MLKGGIVTLFGMTSSLNPDAQSHFLTVNSKMLPFQKRPGRCLLSKLGYRIVACAQKRGCFGSFEHPQA